jgi:hypothetical protein
MVRVYRFRVKDPESDEWIVQLSKATQRRIAQIDGRIIEGSGEDVPDSSVDQEGYYRFN